MRSVKYIVDNLDQFQKVVREIASSTIESKRGATVIGLYGNLGAGKTTFVQTFAKHFGVEETVISPTFVIEKIYPIRTNGRKRPTSNGASEFTHLIHIDAYRLEKSEELLHLGWKEIISDPKNIILIEWPERVSDIMPEHIQIRLKVLDDENSREIEVI